MRRLLVLIFFIFIIISSIRSAIAQNMRFHSFPIFVFNTREYDLFEFIAGKKFTLRKMLMLRNVECFCLQSISCSFNTTTTFSSVVFFPFYIHSHSVARELLKRKHFLYRRCSTLRHTYTYFFC
jgi:hypothetical protein